MIHKIYRQHTLGSKVIPSKGRPAKKNKEKCPPRTTDAKLQLF